jgi:hypothetical protein
VPSADDYSAEDCRHGEDSYDERARLSARTSAFRPWSHLIPPLADDMGLVATRAAAAAERERLPPAKRRRPPTVRLTLGDRGHR